MNPLSAFKILTVSLLFNLVAPVYAIEHVITTDPHRAPSGFFDIHVCNWPDRPPFYLSLFGTEQYNEITSIEVFAPDKRKIGELNLKKFTSSKPENKPERHVFLTQLKIPPNTVDGWYHAKIHFKNKPVETAADFVIHQILSRATHLLPENNAEINNRNVKLSWGAVAGARYYQIFIKDMWQGGKIIHTSKLIKSNHYQLPDNLLQADGYYAWRVHARDVNEHIQLGDFNAGSLSLWSEFNVTD